LYNEVIKNRQWELEVRYETLIKWVNKEKMVLYQLKCDLAIMNYEIYENVAKNIRPYELAIEKAKKDLNRNKSCFTRFREILIT
jgi:hypothetical protein